MRHWIPLRGVHALAARRRLPRQRPRDDGHQQVQRRRFDAERLPAVSEHPESDPWRDRNGSDRRQAPVGNAFGAPALRQHVRQVGGRRRQQAGPEHAVDEHERQHEPVSGDHGVRQGEHGDRRAAGDEDPPRPQSIRERAGQRRREGGGVRQEAEEQAGGERAAAHRQDVKRRRGQQLKRGEEDGKCEAAHHEEARREQAVGRQSLRF